METKKNQKADIRNLRFIFFEIGMLVALGLVLAVFQWGISNRNGILLTANSYNELPLELPPITGLERPKPPEPPKNKAPIELEIIKNTEQTPIDSIYFTSEASPLEPVVTIPITDEPLVEESTYEMYLVDEKPEFKGGEIALLKFIKSQTVYPKVAIENGIEGRVFVSFVISETGKVTQIALLRGADNLLNQEALRVVSLMPDWKPGKQRGKPVKVKFQVPFNFGLNK